MSVGVGVFGEAAMTYATVDDAIAAIGRGDLVLVLDQDGPDAEGSLVAAAEKVTADTVAFMVRYGSGLICLPMEGDRLDDLGLPLMEMNGGSLATAFTASIDFTDDGSAGLSDEDRAGTIRAAVDPGISADHFQIPGHVFPLRCKRGGVLANPGRGESAVDLARLAGLAPAGALCDVIGGDGSPIRGDSLLALAGNHGIPAITVGDLLSFRWSTESLVTREAEASVPTDSADFRAIGYRVKDTGTEHVAFVLGDVVGKEDVLTRVHSACLTGDVFGSLRCDCGPQLRASMDLIGEAGEGVIIYNPTHEGRGTGLIDKLAAYRLQEQGFDTADANRQIGHAVDSRHYGVEAQILLDLGVSSVRLLTNNPGKIDQLRLFGVRVSDRIPLWVGENPHNRFYLETKESRLGHLGDTGDG